MFTECMDGLFHKIIEWCIKCGVIKRTEKTASILQIIKNMVFGSDHFNITTETIQW